MRFKQLFSLLLCLLYFGLTGFTSDQANIIADDRPSLTNTIVVPSAARIADGNSGFLAGYDKFSTCIFQWDVTAVSGVLPTLDLYIDTTVDGTNPVNVLHAAQVSTVSRTGFMYYRSINVLNSIDLTADIAAGGARTWPISKIRIRWVIAGTTPSFTFSVTTTCQTQ